MINSKKEEWLKIITEKLNITESYKWVDNIKEEVNNSILSDIRVFLKCE